MVIYFFTGSIQDCKRCIHILCRPVTLHSNKSLLKRSIDLGQEITGHQVIRVKDDCNIVLFCKLLHCFIQGL